MKIIKNDRDSEYVLMAFDVTTSQMSLIVPDNKHISAIVSDFEDIGSLSVLDTDDDSLTVYTDYKIVSSATRLNNGILLIIERSDA